MPSGFCKGCGARIEWHPRAVGSDIAIDPEPHPDGLLAFNDAMKLVRMPKGSKPRMYRGHLLTCPKPEKARAAPPSVATCDVEDCERTDRHWHCFRCGGTDHFVAECPEER